jgi:2-oxoglutarate ferredoxin oxidoreductase subunit beta
MKPADDLSTYAENTWCPGCGNFGILAAFRDAISLLEQAGIPRSQLVLVTGIGQHGKIFDYLNLSGFYGLHGRSMASAQAIKLANPALRVVNFVGDGDSLGEGLEHTLFAAKRNAAIALIVHDNGVYALTTGQFGPTSARGYRGPSTPAGNVEDPFNPLALVLEAGATFVARGFAGRRQHLAQLIFAAVMHEGFAFVDVLQPCVTFNNTWKLYSELVEELPEPASTREEAIRLARRADRLPIGIFYQEQGIPHHKRVLGERLPVPGSLARAQRIERLQQMLHS